MQLSLREPGLSADAIDAAVEAGLREDEGLDWKRQLPFAGAPKGDELEAKALELAKDVAAMANGPGGVIVFGVQEDRDETPMSVVDVGPENETAEQQMRRVISSRTYPPVSGTKFQWVQWEDGRTVLALYVPASSDAPHLVRPPKNKQDQGWFQAPWRDGSHTRFMTERQIESAYRLREQRRREQGAALRDRFENFVVALGASGRPGIPLEDRPPVSITAAVPLWLVLTAVPTQPRPNQIRFDSDSVDDVAVALRGAMPDQAQDRFRAGSSRDFKPAGMGAFSAVDHRRPTRGLRLFHWTDRPTRGWQQGARVEFHRDGGASLGVTRCGIFEGPQEEGTPGYVSSADAEHLIWELAWILTRSLEQGELTGDVLVRLGTSRPAQGMRVNYPRENRYSPLCEEDEVLGLQAVDGVVVTDLGRTELVASLWSIVEDFLSQRSAVPRLSPEEVVSGLPRAW